MKKLLVLFLPLLFLNCDKEPDVNASKVTGQWLLVATLQDPGDGSGKFIPVNEKRQLHFKADGTLRTYNQSFCNSSASAENAVNTYTYSEEANTITISDCGIISSTINYELKDGLLYVYYPRCIEACALKFRKFED